MKQKSVVLSRAPLRVSFVGGGSDLPQYYENYGDGGVLSMAIDKYVYCSTHTMYDSKVRLHYKYTETVNQEEFCTLGHDLIRCCLEKLDITSGIEVHVFSDITTRGSGLGSSSALANALLLNLCHKRGLRGISKKDLAEMASVVEIEDVGATIGKQDHYASAFGGINHIVFKSGEVSITEVPIPKENVEKLEDSLLLVNTGLCRNASRVLKSQIEGFAKKCAVLEEMVNMIPAFSESLYKGDMVGFANLLGCAWSLKSSLSSSVSTEEIDSIYDFVKSYAPDKIGGKLCGAGGGGFLMFVVPPELKNKIISDLFYNYGGIYKCTNVKMDRDGASVLYEY